MEDNIKRKIIIDKAQLFDTFPELSYLSLDEVIALINRYEIEVSEIDVNFVEKFKEFINEK